MDTLSRRIVGWPAATVKETVFGLDALEMALWQRDREQHPFQPGELIHYSDAGSQYTSTRLAEHLDAAGIAASIESVGDAYDNAVAESTTGLFKTELVKGQGADLMIGPLKDTLHLLTPLRPHLVPSTLGDEAVQHGALATALNIARPKYSNRRTSATD